MGVRVVTESLTEAFQLNSDALLAYFERRVVPRADAGDLLTETLLHAWRRAESAPRDEREVRMWLFGIASRVLANHSRGRRRRAALADRLRLLLTEPLEPDAAEAIAVRDAVAGLDPKQAELVRLVHWDGFSITEAATLLGVNASTARGRYAAAKEELRARLGTHAEVG